MSFYSVRNSALLGVVVLCPVVPSAQAQFTQQGSKLVGTGGVGSSNQGFSAAVSGDGNTAIVGGPSDNRTTGAAWVFTRSGGLWSQQGTKLVGTGAASSADQGWSVSVSGDGNTAIVGGPGDGTTGAAWVFTRSGGVWTQQGDKLVGTGADGIVDQGYSVAVSGDGNTAIVGGPGATGAVWIFTRSGGVWTQQGDKLVGTGEAGQANQGWSVAISGDGNTAVVGGLTDNNFTGAAWVFTRSGGVWTQQGDKLVGTGGLGANQGHSVAVSGDGNTAIVGGPSDNFQAGAAWIFTRSGGVWTQQGDKLVGTGAVGKAQQGYSVAVSGDGNTAIVGGDADNGNRGVGATWVFARSGGVWTQQGDKLVGTGEVGQAQQGYSVAVSEDGNTAIIGGVNDNDGTGAAWVFTRATDTGTINVTTNLDAATFTITGPQDYAGGGTSFTIMNAPVGTYTITYGPVTGYITPPPQTQTLTANGTISFSGTYIPVSNTITVTSTPTGAGFQIAGPGLTFYRGTTPVTFSNAPPGEYTITWDILLGGYETPPPETKTLSPGGNITFVGIYILLPTVVLVHGYCADPTEFGGMESLLIAEGLHVYHFDYHKLTYLGWSATDHTIEEIAYYFGSFVDNMVRRLEGSRPIVVVTHSEGGAVARAWMVGLTNPLWSKIWPYTGQITRLATIGTPHYGQEVSLRAPFCSQEQATELTYGSDFVSRLHDQWQLFQNGPFSLGNDKLLFVAGTHGTGLSPVEPECEAPTPFLSRTLLKGAPCNDGLVDVDSAVLPSASLTDNVRYVPYTHCDSLACKAFLGPGTGEADIDSPNHKTYGTISRWLFTGVPLAQCCGSGTIDYNPSFFTDPSKDQGFLLLRFRDKATGQVISPAIVLVTFNPSPPSLPFGFLNVGSITITQLPAPQLYTISLTFVEYEPVTVPVAVAFNRPTVPDPLLLQHK